MSSQFFQLYHKEKEVNTPYCLVIILCVHKKVKTEPYSGVPNNPPLSILQNKKQWLRLQKVIKIKVEANMEGKTKVVELNMESLNMWLQRDSNAQPLSS